VRACVPAHAHAAVAAWRQAKGFDWVDDTTSYGTHRWGWVTEHIGDSIDLKVRQATAVCMRMILGISLLHAILELPVWAQPSVSGHIPHAKFWRPCPLYLIYVPISSFATMQTRQQAYCCAGEPHCPRAPGQLQSPP